MRLIAMLSFLIGCGGSGALPEPSFDGKGDAVSSDIKTVGAIRYGETQRIAYAGTPKYVAVELSGSGGDRFELSLATDAADQAPAAWVYDGALAKLAAASRPSRNGHSLTVDYALPRTGTYLIALAEVLGRPANLALGVTALACGAPSDCASDQIWSTAACACVAKPAPRKACMIDLDCDVPQGYCCHLDYSCHTNPAIHFDPCYPP